MSFISFLNKLRYGSYKKSRNPSVYEKIASYYRLSPQHVYEIAHGKKPQTMDDQYVFEELLSKGIIVNKSI